MFDEAIKSLDADDGSLVSQQLDAWEAGVSSGASRVARNIKSETALSVSAFAALLQDFCQELRNTPFEATSAWKSACRKNK